MKMTKYREEVEAADKEIVRLKEKILLSSVEESKAIETENALSNQEKLRLEEDARMKEEEIKKLEKDFRVYSSRLKHAYLTLLRTYKKSRKSMNLLMQRLKS